MLASPVPHSLFLLPKGLFEPVAVTQAADRLPSGGATPLLLKGVAAEWPATLRWSFDYLAKIGGPRVVRLVVGNRESGRTAFIHSALDDYLLALHRDGGVSPNEPAPYLKEFELLRQMPLLRGDVRPDELFFRHHIVSSSAWIGPAGAHTGLHRDYLDNLAVLLRGRKRFFLARPGTIESLGGVSRKFDRWACLSRIGIAELVDRGLARGSMYVVDLEPGDALYVPHGWWHEVVNQQPSIFLSGFFGSYPKVIGKWLSTGLRQALHDASTLIRAPDCTCHSHH